MATPQVLTVATSAANTTPALPRADAFDVLPALYEMLSRIDHQAQSDPHPNITGLPASDQDEAAYTDLQPLEPRELPNEVLSIKAKIRRTLRELEKLPDMDRSIEQQEQEIKDLEAKIKQQQLLVNKLAEAARALDG